MRQARPGEVDLVVVRENVEGEYSEIGGRLGRGFPDEMAVQEAVFTRAGTTPVADYAIWTAALLLEHLGHGEAAAEVERAVSDVLAKTPLRTPDLGGTATTETCTRAVLDFTAA